jgi:hypothetical protein
LVPLVFALALDLSFEMPTTEKLKRFRCKHDDVRSLLTKARAGLLALRDFPVKALLPDSSVCELADGSLELDLGPHPIDEMVGAIDAFLKQSQSVEFERRTSPVSCAVRRLNAFVDQNNPSLTLIKRESLCKDLFDEVRKRHGQFSRSHDREHDETYRYRDLLAREQVGSPSAKLAKKAR